MRDRNKMRRRRNSTTVVIVILIVVLTLIIAGVTLLAYNSMKHDRAGENVVDGINKNLMGENGELDAYYKNSKYTGTRNFLVVGKDEIALNTDVMMVVSFDSTNQEIAIMQLPRDTMITINSVPRKLNSVFGLYYTDVYTGSNEKECIENGMKGLAQVLSDNLTIQIDGYAYISLETFGKIVDAIDGVDMYVPFDMKYYDPGQGLNINLKEGQQNLDGDKAEQFVRFRNSFIEGDVGRQDTQKIFMTAFINNFQEKATVTKIASIAKTILNEMIHNLEVDECIALATDVLSMDLNNITMFSAPGTSYNYNGLSYFILQRSAMYEVVNRFFNVLDVDIRDEDFDPEFNFTILNDSGVNSRYNATTPFEEILTAEDIDENGIEVSRAW